MDTLWRGDVKLWCLTDLSYTAQHK